MNLNPQQREAVLHGAGPLLILAGAGSGKTRVLTERICHLVNSGQALSHQIFAVTFTNKAAGEMKTRVEERIGPAARDLWISTFHSSCARILRRHAEAAGLNPHFAIYSGADQLSLMKDVLAELNISDKILSPRGAIEKISRAKDSLISPERFPDGDFYHAKIAATYRRYNEELRKNAALDFGDLIMLTVRLLQNSPEILKHYQGQFRFIMVDEYQDTNHSQYELVRMLAGGHKNICVVGDPDQSIYAWRGADISNILEFERDFEGARVIKLEQNYRSTRTILAASDKLIANNRGRKPKTLWTENPDGSKIRIFESKDDRGEAKMVADEIKRLAGKGVKFSDIAIFYRTNAQSRSFEDELRIRGIPYVIFGGIRFYDRLEVKHVLAYLRLLVNPNDNTSFKRVINVPARGIGKTTLEKIESLAASQGLSIYETIKMNLSAAGLNGGTMKKVLGFVSLLDNLRELPQDDLPKLVTQVVEKTNYVVSLMEENTDEAADRVANVNELISAVAETCRQMQEATLADFLDQVSLISDIDKLQEGEQALPLMTLHLAKGLEFDNVFVVGLEEGLLPHSRALSEDSEMEEERRLLYVGMTRARKELYLTHARERMVRGSYTYNVTSRFLEEVPEKYTEIFKSPSLDFGSYSRNSIGGSSFGHKESESAFGNLWSKRTKGQESSNSFDSEFSQVAPDDWAEEGGVYFKTGQRVRHPIFGDGVVRKAEGKPPSQRLIVQFANGDLKKLAATHANLSVI